MLKIKIPADKLLKFSKIAVILTLLFFLGYLVTFKIPLPAAEDLPRQMANGRDILQGNWDVLTTNFYSYTQQDHYFANHHWLYGVFAYVLHLAVGWSGMVVFKVFVILGMFLLLFKTALKKADFWLVALFSIPAILMIAGRSALRPELFGFLFVIVYFYFLQRLDENEKSKAIFWLIPIQILWANLHITFPIGVMLVGGFLAEKIIKTSTAKINKIFTSENLKKVFGNILVKRLLALFAVLFVVSFFNPLGIKGVIYSLTANTDSSSLVKSSEVQPINSTIDDIPKWASIPTAFVVPAIITIGVSFILAFRRARLVHLLFYIGASVLGFFMIRGAPFLGIILLLAVPYNLNNLFLKLKNKFLEKFTVPKVKIEAIFNIVLACSLLLFMNLKSGILFNDRNLGIGLVENSEDSAKFFLENDIKGPIFNDTDIGSYLTYYLYPKERIYTDNRFGDAYSEEFFANDYVAAVTDDFYWNQLLEKYDFNAIFMYQYDQGWNMRDFMYRRINDPNWVFVYGDRFAIILVRNIPENQEIIDKYRITVDNAYKRFGKLTEVYNGHNQVAAADLYALMGFPDIAMANYAVAVAERPDWAKVWFTMGKMELQKANLIDSDPAIALMYLQQAIDKGWKTTNSYSFLALAYYRLGQLDKVEEAVREELKINPKSEDAQTWLKTIKRERDRMNANL